MKKVPAALKFFNKAFPNGLSDAELTEISNEVVEERTVFTQDTFTAEILDLGEQAYTEQVLKWLTNAEIAHKNKQNPARESVLSPAFDQPTLEELNQTWTAWIKNFTKVGTEPLQPLIATHLKESLRKMAEEEEADKKAFESL